MRFWLFSRIIFVLLLLFIRNTGLSQQSEIDSIRRSLESRQTRDSAMVRLMMEYAFLISATNGTQAKHYLREAGEIAQEVGWKGGHAMSLLLYCELLSSENKYDSSIVYGLEALKFAEKSDDQKLIARAHSDLSESYRLLRNKLTLPHALKYLEIAEQQKNEAMILDAMVKLSTVYDQANDSLNKRATVAKALRLAETQKDIINIARLKETMASENFEKGNYSEALREFQEILSVWDKTTNYAAIAWVQSLISSTYLVMNKRDSARYFGLAALKTAKEHSLVKELGDAHRVLFNYYNNYDDAENALTHYVGYDSVRDVIFDNEASQKVERARMQYEQAKKDDLAQAEQLKKDMIAQRTRNILYSIVGMFVLIAGFLLYNNRQKQKARLRIERAYDALKAAQAQLVQSEKMASLGELTAGIAHEIQNPLNFVNNFSEVNSELLEEALEELNEGNTTEAVELLQLIRENETKIAHHGKRADAIVKGMLQHSRTGSGQKELTDLNALTEEFIRLCYHGIRAKDNSFNATIKTDFDSSLPKIHVVAQDLGRSILNLLTNAFYAVNEKRRSGIADYEPMISIETKNLHDQNVEIIIKDNGNGIPKNIMDKIFQPFFTTKPTGQGTGLGLSLTYDIIKAHGGELKVDSAEGKGSEFSIVLPV